jgi:hypothetical protein
MGRVLSDGKGFIRWEGFYQMSKSIIILLYCVVATFLPPVNGNETNNSLFNEKQWLESLKPTLSDEDQILHLADLKYFFDNGAPDTGWYDQIIRVKLDLGFRPACVEIGKKQATFFIFVKYTDGERIKFNGSFFYASKGLIAYRFVVSDKDANYQTIANVFNGFKYFSMSPENVPKSDFQQDIEFFSGLQPTCYLKTIIWGRPDQSFLRDGLMGLQQVTLALLGTVKEFDKAIINSWVEELSTWRKK